jgi:hypothetical protein
MASFDNGNLEGRLFEKAALSWPQSFAGQQTLKDGETPCIVSIRWHSASIHATFAYPL